MKQAALYLQVAELVLAEEDDAAVTVATGNAVLAGIAAADAICCTVTGMRWRGQDHAGAVQHLESATGDAKLAGLLRDVINAKDNSHYGLTNTRRSTATSAARKAGQLVDAARDRVR